MIKNRQPDLDEFDIDTIRRNAERRFGRKIAYPSDCDQLSEIIYTTTQRSISGTTLKRFFGFVAQTSKFSRYTLDTLIEYANTKPLEPNFEFGYDMDTLAYKVQELTTHNQQIAASCSGITYNKTVSRQSINESLDKFLATDSTATAYIAPTGYGKSIALTRWIQEQQHISGSDDLILFVNGSILLPMITENYRLKDWFNDQVGFPIDPDFLADSIRQHKENRRFILVIDGFEVQNPVDKQSKWFIDDLLSLISASTGKSWYKIIINCRPLSWFSICKQIGDNQILKNCWYGVDFSGTFESSINVPLLSEDEVNEVVSNVVKLNFAYKYIILSLPQVSEMLIHPLMLELFLLSPNRQKSFRSEIDLFSDFTQRVIFREKNMPGKLQIINILIEKSDYGVKGNLVSKEEVKEIIAEHKESYNDLLQMGFIYENYQMTKYLDYKTNIKFTHESFFEFFVANSWLRRYDFNEKLFKKVADYYGSNSFQFGVVKWLLRYAFHEEKVELVSQLYKILDQYFQPFFESDHDSVKSYQSIHYDLLLHVGVCLRENEDLRNKILVQFSQDEYAQENYFHLFYDFDFLVRQYADSLRSYSEISPQSTDQLLALTMNYLKAFYTKDSQECKVLYDKIKRFDVSTVNDPVILALHFGNHLLHEHFILDGIKSDIMAWLTYEEQVSERSKAVYGDFPVFRFYLTEALNLCNQNEAVLKILEDVVESDQLTFQYNTMSYYKLLITYYAYALLQTGQYKEGKTYFDLIRMYSLPLNGKYYWGIRYDLAHRAFLQHEGEKDQVRKLTEKIQTMARHLQYLFFEKESKQLLNAL